MAMLVATMGVLIFVSRGGRYIARSRAPAGDADRHHFTSMMKSKVRVALPPASSVIESYLRVSLS